MRLIGDFPSFYSPDCRRQIVAAVGCDQVGMQSDRGICFGAADRVSPAGDLT